ncbi:DUF3303 family protein [Streptomyces sp. G-G2]|uniref:DUF3303 family protein n=1 Tax=Streptomyces sp. G-G2 TaxID=3046201 RepID=UPI0024B8F68F|nr:DUF3303 family protein [Streptomyces sp. G-G2]MDJ0379692.1 hypothetical protein [Streptomyces sp. G-G2]
MRVMLRMHLDTAAANEGTTNGTLERAMGRLMEALNPEASYFGLSEGVRSCWIVFDMRDSSQLPTLTEELFVEFGAEIEIAPVMDRDDLAKGLRALGTAGH